MIDNTNSWYSETPAVSGTTGPHSYRDFIDPAAPMYRSDREILDQLCTHSQLSAGQLSENRFRENVIRLQLEDLARSGAVRKIDYDTYTITAYGTDLARDPSPVPVNDGLFEVHNIAPEQFPADSQRLCDFSSLDGKQ